MIRETIPLEHARHNLEIEAAVKAMRVLKLNRQLSLVGLAALKYLESLYTQIWINPAVTFARKQTERPLAVAKASVEKARRSCNASSEPPLPAS